MASIDHISEEFHELRTGIVKAIQIADIDPEMSLTRSRKVLEYVIRDVYTKRYKEPPGTRPLENLIQRLVKDEHFPVRLEAYASAIRKLGNVGTHAFQSRVTADDVYLSISQLLPVLEWYFESEQHTPIEGESSTAREKPIDPDALLIKAHALQAERKWLEAAEVLEQYGKERPEDWGACYSRGLAFANARAGKQADIASLRAYNDAITFAPESLDDNLRARLFSYRGALLKRLGRLEEATGDLQIALKFATAVYETADIKYNLACLDAMEGLREKMMERLRALRAAPAFFASVRAHLHDYFSRYAEDDEFLNLIK